MPSKNGFNKPTQGILLARKARANQKRILSKNHQSYQPKLTSAALYALEKINKESLVTNKRHQLTTQTLSKKKLRKVERNLKHLQKNGVPSKLLDRIAQAKEGEMEVEEETEPKQTLLRDQAHFVREALWTVVEDAQSSGLLVDHSGEGTTLGYAEFY